MEAKDQNSFVIMDVGAGNFQWINNMAHLISSDNEIPKNMTINIIGLAGESYDNKVIIKDNTKTYYYGGFKIEEIIQEFSNNEVNYVNQVDFMVSRWTLRHLVDPVGTFQQMSKLLKPHSGLLFMDGFIFDRKDSKGNLMYESTLLEGHLNMLNLLDDFKLDYLMCPYISMRSLNQFAISKPYSEEVNVPLDYTGKIKVSKFPGLETHSTEFYSFSSDKLTPSPLFNLHLQNRFFGDKKIYDWFEENNLFDHEEMIWIPGYLGEIISKEYLE